MILNSTEADRVANKALVVHNPELTLEQKVLGLLLCIPQEKKVEIDRRIEAVVPSFLPLDLLHALSTAPGGRQTVDQLERVMVDDRPNVSRTLSKLAGPGFVRKERSEDDQRTVHLSITEAGERAHEEADDRLLHLSTGLEERESKQLFDRLVKL